MHTASNRLGTLAWVERTGGKLSSNDRRVLLEPAVCTQVLAVADLSR
jgi:hypothetical protein